MGLVGMYFLAKTLNSSSGRGYGGRSSYDRKSEEQKAQEAEEKRLKLVRAREAMAAVDGENVESVVEVPARVRKKGVQRLFISKKRNIKHTTIRILKADKNGVQMPELGVDLSRYSVVGVYDNDKFCAYDKTSGEMILLSMTARFEYGPHGDYDSFENVIGSAGSHFGQHLADVLMYCTVVKPNGEVKYGATIPRELAFRTVEGKYKFGEAVYDAKISKQAEAQKQSGE